MVAGDREDREWSSDSDAVRYRIALVTDKALVSWNNMDLQVIVSMGLTNKPDLCGNVRRRYITKQEREQQRVMGKMLETQQQLVDGGT